MPGMSPSCTSGSANVVFGWSRADAIAAGERDLETAAEAGAVNRGDDGDAQRLQPVEQVLADAADALRVGRRPELEELLDVGAGDEAVRVCRRSIRLA